MVAKRNRLKYALLFLFINSSLAQAQMPHPASEKINYEIALEQHKKSHEEKLAQVKASFKRTALYTGAVASVWIVGDFCVFPHTHKMVKKIQFLRASPHEILFTTSLAGAALLTILALKNATTGAIELVKYHLG
jgi:hypothetical protein